MKLLILTQKVDKEDGVLGFMHHWLLEFAKKTEKITVICLYKGEYDLPPNVKVLSLGKERGVSHLEYLVRFYKYIWNERKNYDKVLVHMNQEYMLLGGLLWKILGKGTAMWRNHPIGSFLTRLAVYLADDTMCTSGSSYTARFKKTILMPAGVDTSYFKRDNSSRRKDSILFLSRVDPIKRPEVLIEAFEKLPHDDIASLDFYGDIKEEYKKHLLSFTSLPNRINFYGKISHLKSLDVYNSYAFSANLTFSGSLDKTMLEHMATEGVVFISNDYLLEQLPTDLRSEIGFKDADSADLALKIKNILSKTDEEIAALGKKLRKFVEENHSLGSLIEKLLGVLAKHG